MDELVKTHGKKSVSNLFDHGLTLASVLIAAAAQLGRKEQDFNQPFTQAIASSDGCMLFLKHLCVLQPASRDHMLIPWHAPWLQHD